MQPPIELAVNAPLQVRESGDEMVVGYRGTDGSFQVLKRIQS